MPKITKRLVDSLRPDPGGADVFTWDSELRGFGVRLKPSGAASYFVQYRTAEGRTRRFAFGKVGTLTPDEARKVAREKLRDAANGGDPSAERRRLRNAMTVAELCDFYLAEAVGRVKASTLAMDRSRVETHVKPLIGRRAVTTLTLEDVERLQLDIATGKTAKPPKRDKDGKRRGRGGLATGGRGVAARTVGMLRTILEFGRRRKLMAENPARGVARLPEGRQRRFLSLDEIASLGQTMRDMAAVGENGTALAAIRLLLTSGLRRMEALALPSAWVDSRLRCIRFEDTKSGAQLRPIGAAAVKLIDAQIAAETTRHTRRARDAKAAGGPVPAEGPSRWVFPAATGSGHLVGVPKVLARICARAKLDGVTVHVLRHTFAAVAAELGYSELTIAGLLGHAVPGVTARYAHVPDSALGAAADRVAAHIAAALDGNVADATVVSLPKRA
ncbi:MAG: tyrosine-type recombinase/integrase [Stellaceae bacterium]